MFCCTDEVPEGLAGVLLVEGSLLQGNEPFYPVPRFSSLAFWRRLEKVIAKVVLDGHTMNARFAPAMYKYILCDEDGSGSAMSVVRSLLAGRPQMM